MNPREHPGTSFPVRDLLHLHSISSIGPSRMRKLIEAFKTPDRLYGASVPEIKRVDGFNDALANQVRTSLASPEITAKVDEQIEKLGKYKTRVVTIWDGDYPGNLRNIFNPPLLLFVRGELLPCDTQSIAVVGSRSVSEYGRAAAERIAGDIAARGITVVSGMAEGIDSYAHWSAIRAGGRTIAVLGNGLDIVYPPSNNTLYRKIIANGAVVTEYFFGTKPLAGNFPARNRIISGLSLGTLVVEARKKSGALITAATALEQNREVFAVPGNISSSSSDGTNALIRDGAAKLVQSAEDVVNEIPFTSAAAEGVPETLPPPVRLSAGEETVFALVEYEPEVVDVMSQKSGIPTQKLLAHLLTLELKGLIRRLSGGKYVRV